jgi:hypothetical protein
MAAKYIFAALALTFLIAAAMTRRRAGGRPHPAQKTWLLVGTIFAAVSIWLSYR